MIQTGEAGEINDPGPYSLKVIGERHTGTNALSSLLRVNSDARLVPGTLGEHFAARTRSVQVSATALPSSIKKVWLDHLIQGFPARLFPHGSRAQAAYLTWLRRRIGRRSPEMRERLIDRSFLHAPAEYFWKHSAIGPMQRQALEEVKAVILVKHPLSWAASMFRRPHHAWFLDTSATDFARFLRSPWLTVQRENSPSVFPNLLQLWLYKVNSYVDFLHRRDGRNAMILRFEDLVRDQPSVLSSVEQALKVGIKSSTTIDEDVKEGSRSLGDIQTYYSEERWRDIYQQDDLDFCADQLADATDLLSRFQYSAE